MALLEVENLRTRFATDRGVVRAVDGVSFTLEQGEVLGLVGESGSGKSVTSLSLMRLIREPPGKIEADKLVFDGVDLLKASESTMSSLRGGKMAMIFQDPMRSLNPVLTVGRQLTETLRRHLRLDGDAARRRAIELLEMVGIPLAEKRLNSYPHQFSGGMRQRVMIAIALSCNPRLLIADEATTALDVTIQAQIVDLVKRLTRDLGTAVIWISHDLGLVAGLCNRVNVMYAGRIAETGSVRDVFYRPSHGYTVGLIGCTPRVDRVGAPLTLIEGRPPDLIRPISLCPFLPRCAVAIDACNKTMPAMNTIEAGHAARCHADLSVFHQKGAA
ncbi:MAG: peptide ABC transporter ATP-binding protein [Rhizobiales bacterium 65-9]|nr:ABC transporter ATP-binding protein [Hyphomicrobiales bacterium]OJY38658.1 MAG: peptide ABC transporter ATP-binding protein [Rhizobiales bacterium 65-9]